MAFAKNNNDLRYDIMSLLRAREATRRHTDLVFAEVSSAAASAASTRRCHRTPAH